MERTEPFNRVRRFVTVIGRVMGLNIPTPAYGASLRHELPRHDESPGLVSNSLLPARRSVLPSTAVLSVDTIREEELARVRHLLPEDLVIEVRGDSTTTQEQA